MLFSARAENKSSNEFLLNFTEINTFSER